MKRSSISHSDAKRAVQIHLVIDDEKSTLRAEAIGDAITALKSEGRRFYHSNFQPTGRHVKRGEALKITVSPFIPGIEVVIGQYGKHEHLNDGINTTPVVTQLNSGANIITASQDGMVYIQNKLSDKEVIVDVHGGHPVPTYIKGVTERSEFDAQIVKWNTAPFIELIGEYVIANFQYAMAVPSLNETPTNLDQRIDMMDKVVAITNAFYGLSQSANDFAHKYSHRIYISNPDTGPGYASATDYHITFQNDSKAGRHLLVSREDDQFGYYHEVGHTYQMDEIRWSGLGEITVNLAALYVLEVLGQPNYLDEEKTYQSVLDLRKIPIHDRDFTTIDGRLKLYMFDQLRRGFGDHFYAHLTQRIRMENAMRIPEPKDDLAVQQHFMLTAASIGNRNLIPFFEEWGMPIDSNTRTELAKFPALKHPIWNNLNRHTDIIEHNLIPLEVPSLLTTPTDGALFDVNYTPVYKGRGTPGAQISIEQGLLVGDWYNVGTTTVNDSGDWSFTGTKLPIGIREARVVQSNGGTGFARNHFTVIEVAELPVTLKSPADGAVFDVNHYPVYSGRGTPGALITIEQGQLTGDWYNVGETLVDTNGNWSFVGDKLPASNREARAIQDRDGTVSTENHFTVTHVAESPVTLTSPADGVVFDVNHLPVYSGRGTPGAQITIEQGQPTGGGYNAGETCVDTNGYWSCSGNKLPAGNQVAWATQDSDGTVSTRNHFTVTSVAEFPVTLVSPATDDVLNDSYRPLYSGRGAPSARITIQQGTLSSPWYLVGGAIVDTNGDWFYLGHALPASTREARALQSTDGTTSRKSVFTVTHLIEPPVSLISPGEGAAFDESDVPVYNGTGTPGALIVIDQGLRGERWRRVGITRVTASGNWSLIGHALTAGDRITRAIQYVDGVASTDKKTFTVVRT